VPEDEEQMFLEVDWSDEDDEEDYNTDDALLDEVILYPVYSPQC
jgi:hypothetical protein